MILEGNKDTRFMPHCCHTYPQMDTTLESTRSRWLSLDIIGTVLTRCKDIERARECARVRLGPRVGSSTGPQAGHDTTRATQRRSKGRPSRPKGRPGSLKRADGHPKTPQRGPNPTQRMARGSPTSSLLAPSPIYTNARSTAPGGDYVNWWSDVLLTCLVW